jgi:hypothetical protein
MRKLSKRFLALLFFAGIFINADAQVKTKTFAEGIPSHLLPVKSTVVKTRLFFYFRFY